jgi:hypothetical protein
MLALTLPLRHCAIHFSLTLNQARITLRAAMASASYIQRVLEWAAHSQLTSGDRQYSDLDERQAALVKALRQQIAANPSVFTDLDKQYQAYINQRNIDNENAFRR